MSHQITRALLLAAAIGLLAACGGVPGSGDDPAAVARNALSIVQSKDLDGLTALACEAQKADIAEQFDFAAGLSQIAPGIDPEQVLAAINIDTSNVTVGDATVNGDSATVQLAGSMSLDIDVEKLKPIMKAALVAQGMPSDDATIDAALSMMGTISGQEIPMTETMSLVKEGGAWKICE